MSNIAQGEFMKKLFIGLLALSSVSVFAQSNVENCLHLTRKLLDKELICVKQMNDVTNSTGNSINAMKKLAECLSKSDKICFGATNLEGDRINGALDYIMNTVSHKVSCQREQDEIANNGGRESLKKLSDCMIKVESIFLNTIR
jgi:hypothetical protein